MRNYVIINGVSSLTIPGLAIRELPAISKTLMRNQKEEIDGRDGDIITELGYSAYDKTMTIGLYGSYDINQIIAFFNQKGTIVFSDEADKYYNFTILERIDYDKLVKFRTATVKMHCQPYKYPVTETPVEIEAEYITAEAEDITLNNTGVAALEIGLKGNKYQETTTGKNLIRFPYDATSGTYGNVAVTMNNDGSVTFSGTGNETAYINIITQGNKIHLGAGTYTLSTKNAGIEFTIRDTAGNLGYIARTQTSATFTLSEAKDVYLYFAVRNGVSYNVTIYPMLETESSATEWEKPTNGASPNPDYPQEVQVVTGDNTIKVENRNLIPTEYDTYWESGAYDTSGNKATNISRCRLKKLLSLKPGTYYVSTNNSSYVCIFRTYKNGVFVRSIGSINNGNTFTLNDNENQVSVTMGHVTITTSIDYEPLFEDGTIKPFICLNSEQDKTYIPHQEQSYEINLPIQNLFNKNSANLINCSMGGQALNTSSNAKTLYISCQPNTTYTVSKISSKRFTIGTTTTLPANGVVIDGKLGDDTGTKLTITTNNNAKYLCVYYFLNGTDTLTEQEILDTIQIELGSNANHYWAYGTTPIELCKIGTYQDYLYKSGENWYKHTEIGKITFIGNETENWSKYTSTDSQGNTYGFNISLPNTPLQVTNASNFALSNYFKQNNRNAVSIIDTRGVYLGSGNTLFLKIDQSLVSGGTDTNFKTWLSTHNTIVYYALATPTEEQITNAELIEQLESLLTAVSYEDQTNITQDNDNLGFIISASALKKGTDMAVVNNQGNIAAKPIIAVKGNGTLGIYLDNTQMFSLNMTSDITIDTENMEAYDPNTSQLRNRQVTGDYSKFALQPGNNTIKVTGDFTSVTITNWKRWL